MNILLTSVYGVVIFLLGMSTQGEVPYFYIALYTFFAMYFFFRLVEFFQTGRIILAFYVYEEETKLVPILLTAIIVFVFTVEVLPV